MKAALQVQKNILRFLLPVAVLLILPACGTAASSGPSTSVSLRPDPTSTPTTVAASGRKPTPTSVVSDLVATGTYTHSSNRFSIDYPANWEPFERPDGVVFIEPGDRAGYSVFFNDVGQVYTEQELNQYLVTFVAQNFVDEESDFSAISQEQKADGSIEAQFASLDPNLGRAINEIQVTQADTVVFVLLISATQEQWDISRARLQELLDTFTPLDTTPIEETPPTAEPPLWVIIGPTSSKFAFFYPSDWEILRRDEDTVAVAMPNTEITFEVSTFERPGPKDDFEAAEKAALAYVSTISKQYEEFEHLPPAEFPLGALTGSTVDFLYTTEEGQEMAGSVVVVAHEDSLYRVVFSSPAEFYEAALQWFNPMYKSFKILSPEELIQ